MIRPLRIVTRNSRLAMWQANHVGAKLKNLHPNLDIQLLPIHTRSDTAFDHSLSASGYKGLFTKELERALLDKTADMAVHSIKDVPATLPEGLILATVLPRENPADAFVSNQYASISQLPDGAIVGTASLRRQCQLLHHYPHLQIKPLRGNVDTRIAKLKTDNYAAIVLACAGLIRLDLAHQIRETLPIRLSVPAIGQGAIGIECRVDDLVTRQRLADLHHQPTADCVTAERAVSQYLGADCHSPLAAYAIYQQGRLHITARVGSVDGVQLLSSEAAGDREQAQKIGMQVAAKLREQGADQLLKHD